VYIIGITNGEKVLKALLPYFDHKASRGKMIVFYTVYIVLTEHTYRQ